MLNNTTFCKLLYRTPHEMTEPLLQDKSASESSSSTTKTVGSLANALARSAIESIGNSLEAAAKSVEGRCKKAATGVETAIANKLQEAQEEVARLI